MGVCGGHLVAPDKVASLTRCPRKDLEVCMGRLDIAFELDKQWCAILGLNQWQIATSALADVVAARRIHSWGTGGFFQLGIDETAGQAGKSDQLAAFIQQRVRRSNRRRRPTPFPSCTAKSRQQSQLGVHGFDVAHARRIWLSAAGSTSPGESQESLRWCKSAECYLATRLSITITAATARTLTRIPATDTNE